MSLEQKIDTLRLLLELIKNSEECNDKTLNGMAREARTIIRDLQQYFFVLQLYSDQTLSLNVFQDPSVKYFGMDWAVMFQMIDDLKELIEQYSRDLDDSDIHQILSILQKITGDLNGHIEAVRSVNYEFSK